MQISFPSLEPVCCSMSSSNCCFLTCIQISQEGRLLFLGLSILFVLACILPFARPTPIVITATSPVSTETPLPSATLPVTSTAPNNPSCTVLQDLNLRSGPGTAYNPPLTQLNAGTEFIPIGFNPQGVPGGPWVQAQVESINQTGWVSAGSQFISCNLELATLPSVQVPPPPQPARPKIGLGAGDGNLDS